MNITYSKKFIKQSKKLSPKLRLRLYERIQIFRENPMSPELRNHHLQGKHKAYRSIDITSDYRALYLHSIDEIIFDQVGTHSQLYG